jgi:hypothetical protein
MGKMMEYQGEDLILITGAPGTRWSASIQSISAHPHINLSDHTEERMYERTAEYEDGKKAGIGWHRGVYFGPHHEFGHTFDNLESWSKEDLLTEFKKAFSDWEPGIKIIKSHWFAYSLDHLHECFPKARIVAYYLPDELCLKWWQVVGGFDIEYPHYDWYETNERMLKQIKIENACSIKFATEMGIEFKRYKTLAQIHSALGLDPDLVDYNDVWNRDPKIQTLAEQLADKEWNLDTTKGREAYTKHMLDDRSKANMVMIYNPNEIYENKIIKQDLIDSTVKVIDKYGRK